MNAKQSIDSRREGRLVTALALFACGCLCLAGCDSRTTDNFPSPPAGPPPSCSATTAILGCEGGSQGYSCTSDRPDHGDASLVCSDGTPGGGGTTLYCCAPYGTYYSECYVDTTLAGCVNDSFGFRCTGETSPSEADASLACSTPVTGAAGKAYCCSSAVPAPTCTADLTVTACRGTEISYSCVGSDAPNQNDSSTACARLGDSNGGANTAYCCLPFQQSMNACVESSAPSCANGDYAFSCAGPNTPDQTNPALTCKGAGAQLFCCQFGSM